MRSIGALALLGFFLVPSKAPSSGPGEAYLIFRPQPQKGSDGKVLGAIRSILEKRLSVLGVDGFVLAVESGSIKVNVPSDSLDRVRNLGKALSSNERLPERVSEYIVRPLSASLEEGGDWEDSSGSGKSPLIGMKWFPIDPSLKVIAEHLRFRKSGYPIAALESKKGGIVFLVGVSSKDRVYSETDIDFNSVCSCPAADEGKVVIGFRFKLGSWARMKGRLYEAIQKKLYLIKVLRGRVVFLGRLSLQGGLSATWNAFSASRSDSFLVSKKKPWFYLDLFALYGVDSLPVSLKLVGKNRKGRKP